MVQATYTDLLLTFIALCLAVLATSMVVVWVRLARTLRGVDDLCRQAIPLVPRLYELAREAEESLRSVRRLAARADRIGHDLEDVAIRARSVANPLLAQLESATRSLQHITALAVGIKAALGVLHRSAAGLEGREEGDS